MSDYSIGPDEIDVDALGNESFDVSSEPPHPVNWNLRVLMIWRPSGLNLTDGLTGSVNTTAPASVIPPFWHHHPELVWELSALHLHWLCAYDPEQNGSAPLGWHRDFVDARQRLRDWVAASGTRLDRDRPTRQTTWPGEEPAPHVEDIVIEDRDDEFTDFVLAEVNVRRAQEDEFYRTLDPETGGSVMSAPIRVSRPECETMKCMPSFGNPPTCNVLPKSLSEWLSLAASRPASAARARAAHLGAVSPVR